MYKMTKVNSSAIAEIGYDKDTGTLKITFNSGLEYEYPNFEEAQYKEFLHAPSIGKYYNKNIRSSFSIKR
jgi:hypothetical protein